MTFEPDVAGLAILQKAFALEREENVCTSYAICAQELLVLNRLDSKFQK